MNGNTLVRGTQRIIKTAHTAGAAAYHAELYSDDTGDSNNEVSLRFHQGSRYWGQIRYRLGGFRFTNGSDDNLTTVNTGALFSNGAITFTTLGVATNRLIQANAAGVLSASGLDPANILTTANINGTTNFVARFTGANSIGNGIIQDNGSRIGIGTPPHGSYLVQAAGDVLLTSGWLRTTGSTGWFNETHGGGWYMTDATWIRSYNNKSIYQNTGTLRTDGTFQVGGSGATFNVVNNGNLAYRTNVLFANTANNVGVGTAAPTQKLDVDGQVRIRGGSPALGRVLTSDANGVGSWSNTPSIKPPTTTFTVDGSFNEFYPVVFQDASWDDGPMELEIARSSVHTNSSWRGSLQARFWSHSSRWGHGSQFIDAQIHYGTETFIAGYDYNPFSSQFVVWLRGGGTTYTMRSNNLTTVTDFSATAKTLVNGWAAGIKTAIDAYVNSAGHRVDRDFHVNGRIKTNAINETSDIRYKENVQQVTDALDKVKDLRGVYYNWKIDDFPKENFGAGRQIGVIAQEIEQILPEVVNTSESGYKSVEYSHIVPLLIEALKEQQGIIEHQAAGMTELRSIVKDLQQRAVFTGQVATDHGASVSAGN